MKKIKGTNAFNNFARWGIQQAIRSTISIGARLLVRAAPYIAVGLAVVLLTAPISGIGEDAYWRNYNSKSKPYNKGSNIIKKYHYTSNVVRYSSTGVRSIVRISTTISAAYLAEKIYKINYKNYINLKGAELGKIGFKILSSQLTTIKLTQEIYQSFIRGDHKKTTKKLIDDAGDGGNKTEFILKVLRFIKNSPSEGYKHIQDGNILKGIARISLGTGLGEFIGFYLISNFIPDKAMESIIEQISKQ